MTTTACILPNRGGSGDDEESNVNKLFKFALCWAQVKFQHRKFRDQVLCDVHCLMHFFGSLPNLCRNSTLLLAETELMLTFILTQRQLRTQGPDVVVA